jgi:hypothetical protein
VIDYDDDEVFALVLERDRLRLEVQHLREQGRQVEVERDRFRSVLAAIGTYEPDPELEGDTFENIAEWCQWAASNALERKS